MLLDERIIEKLTERLVERIEQGNTYILKQIGENIKQISSVIPSRAYQLVQMLKYGGNYNKILRELARITELNIKDIEDIFEAVAKENQLFAKQFYDYKNVKYIPYNENITLQNQVKALAKITMGEYLNISNTTAIGFTVKDLNGNIVFRDIGTMYKEVIDKAVLNVGQGKDTFYNQMRNVLNELGESGLKTLDYASGRHMRLDSAVRMNMQGALRDLSNTLQRQFGEEYGADGIEVSVHNNPAPDHEKIQGHQFTFEEYENFKSDLPFKDINGNTYPITERHIGEWNCYHYEFNIIVGVNKPNYTEEQLQQIIDNNKKGFEIDGKHYTNYEGTQLQRRMETEIRKQKDKQILAKASGDDELSNDAQKSIKQLTLKYKELSDVSGLPTKMQRLNYSKNSTMKSKNDIITPTNLIDKLNINLREYKTNNDIQERTSKLLGMDKGFNLLSKDAYELNKGESISRVIHKSSNMELNEIYDNSLKGQIKYSKFDRSSYGRGIYFVDSSKENIIIEQHGKKYGEYMTIKAKLNPKANILTFNNELEFYKDIQRRISKLPDNLQDFYKKEKSLLYMLDGYKGIQIKSNKYFCIYDRSVLYVSK